MSRLQGGQPVKLSDQSKLITRMYSVDENDDVLCALQDSKLRISHSASPASEEQKYGVHLTAMR